MRLQYIKWQNVKAWWNEVDEWGKKMKRRTIYAQELHKMVNGNWKDSVVGEGKIGKEFLMMIGVMTTKIADMKILMSWLKLLAICVQNTEFERNIRKLRRGNLICFWVRTQLHSEQTVWRQNIEFNNFKYPIDLWTILISKNRKGTFVNDVMVIREGVRLEWRPLLL